MCALIESNEEEFIKKIIIKLLLQFMNVKDVVCVLLFGLIFQKICKVWIHYIDNKITQ
jgi:predicted metallopeptidase